MQRELASLKEFSTWELVERPKNAKVIKNRWVYNLKDNAEKAKYKVRLVVKGFMQDANGIELFSPVVRYDTNRAVLGLASARSMNMVKFDVSTAFLNGNLKENVFMEQPEGHEDGSRRVCLLNKSLYGLRQSPKCWSDEIENFFGGEGFNSGEGDSCLYIKREGIVIILVLLNVDDGLVMSTSSKLSESLLVALRNSFKITVEHKVTSFLGMKIEQSGRGICLKHPDYINNLCIKYRMEGATSVDHPMPVGWESVESKRFENTTFYRELVGKLMYLHTICRPDIGYVTNVLSRVLDKPSVAHWELAKRVVRYLKGTKNMGVLYKKEADIKIEAHSDADFAGDKSTRKSTSGVIVSVAGTPVVWKSRLQSVVAMSTTEAELIAGVDACKEVIWLKKLYRYMGVNI